MSDGGEEIKKALEFTPAASFWASYKHLSSILYGIGCIVALPSQLILHRRIGERYLNIVNILLASGAAIAMVAIGQGVSAAAGKSFARPTGWDLTAAALSFFLASVIVPAFYLLHRYMVWRRDRGGDMVHTRSWGVPFYMLRWKLRDAQAGIEPAAAPEVDASAPPLTVFAELVAEFRQGWRQMFADRAAGLIPQGWVPWIVMTILHPAAVMLLGAGLLFVHVGFGLVLVVGGFGMFIEARITAAFFREQLLDHRDSKIEQAAWTQIVQGKPHTGEQHGYAVPIASSSLPQELKDSIVVRLRGPQSRTGSELETGTAG